MLQFKHFGSRGNKLPPSSFKSTPAILGVCIINNDQNFIAWALMNTLDFSVFQFVYESETKPLQKIYSIVRKNIERAKSVCELKNRDYRSVLFFL